MNLTTLYFVRHAESDHTIRADIIRPLTTKGHADALRVTTALQTRNIARIYSSPYMRTVDTIRNLAETLALDIVTRDDLRERNVGGWVEDFMAYARLQWEDFTYKNPGGECLAEVQKRNIAAVLSIIEDNPGLNVVIGTHGTALSTILNYFDPDFGFDYFYQLVHKMPYILRVKFSDSQLVNISEIEF